MSKTKSFRTKLWMYFALFASIIFALLWLFQTVFLEGFYNDMLINNTREAASEISAQSKSAEITEVIDRLSLDNSLLVFVTDTDGKILYSSDSYRSYYHVSANDGCEKMKLLLSLRRRKTTRRNCLPMFHMTSGHRSQ